MKRLKSRRPVTIIAEAGVNHNGDIELAKRLIDVASDAGADYVKFQTFTAKNTITSRAAKADYQKKAMETSESQLDMIRRLELDRDAHEILIEHCGKRGIGFLSTPFDLESIDLLLELGIEVFKIPSGEITNLPYLRKIGRCGKPLILSTGMATLGEIEAAMQVLLDSGCERDQITVLHCNTEYPTPMKDVNLRAMLTLKNALKTKVGYSDHTLGTEVSIAATAMGARVIEKHFTLDRTMEGPDHSASLEPQELCNLVLAIRNIEFALGSGVKQPSPSEMPNREAARKSIVASVAILEGEEFSERNLAVKRPGSGISPMRWDEMMGRIAKRSYDPDDLIEL